MRESQKGTDARIAPSYVPHKFGTSEGQVVGICPCSLFHSSDADRSEGEDG
jgi:hypothetical protein